MAKLRFEGLSDADVTSACEAIGRFTVTVSYLDIEISKLMASMFELHRSPFADNLIHSIDLGRKREIINAFAKPLKTSQLAVDLAKLASDVGDTVSDRNVVAHGALRLIDDQICIASFGAQSEFRMAAAFAIDGRPSVLRVADLPAKTEKAAGLGLKATRLAAVMRQMHDTLS